MVNTLTSSDAGFDTGTPIGAAAALGGGVGAPAKLHPFGDLHTLQHLSARAARGVRQAFEGYWRAETRAWAEPLEVLRLADYRAARGDKLTAWVPLSMDGRTALCVLDSQFVVEVIDLFFGGTGDVSPTLALEFTPAADVLVARIAAGMARALEIAWEPLARARFTAEPFELGSSMIPGVEADEVVVATRFAIARGTARPSFVDILYPVATLKPHTVALTGKVVAKPAEVDAEWRTQLTRAAMAVRLPVRSVLAEPSIPLSRLLDLKEGDVIPISFGADVPIVIGGVALGLGTVGTSNGRAAIRISKFEGPLQ
ncbi:flagellar motor switch protein FliM [Sphingomonas sp. Leaf231]|uniref:flagellar motor switch protein FliM n=1 Tax=Sphingomonas sp. Leaf231 TaxID=1736301 RepID=UPI0006FD16E9|nr:flagellar motor switch protein FliM [Sphingomonas sp. Leaf231]KQN92372.1 flagellar motor switch protein FliM [Sphingomonas sp. Leaf231]